MAHNYIGLFQPYTFKLIFILSIPPFLPTAPTSTHGEARLIQSSRSEPRFKNYLKWWEILLLVSYILDDIEGKKLV